ncbi:hypothetical protein ACFFU5_15545, partial [Pseudofulvimonas gallinarii]
MQSWRLSKLPTPEVLRAALADASEASGFDAAFFEPMVQDVAAAQAPDAAARIAAAQADGPAGMRLAAMFREHQGRSVALVQLSGLQDPQALEAALDGRPDARILDLKAVAEGMVA